MIRKIDLPYTMRSGGRLYFRRGKGALVRLPEPTDPAFLAAYEAAKRGRPAAPSRTSVAALLDSYGRSTRWDRLAPRTRADYRKVMDYLRAKIGDRDVSEITRPLILEAMEANRHRARFANYVAQVASVLCEHAIDLGWRRDNPVKGVRLLKMGDGWDPWPQGALDAYRAVAKDEARWIWGLAYWTGQRIGDVLRMRWDDVVRDSDGEDGIEVEQGKTGAKVWIPILPGLRELLTEIPRRGFTILAQKNSRPLSYRQASFAVEKAREASGTKAYVLHGLRANAASELYEAGCTDAQVQAITGHTNASSAQRYGRGARQKRLAKDAMRKRGE